MQSLVREEEGPGDAYWIKSYINGELQTDLQDIITCIDSASEGVLLMVYLYSANQKSGYKV